MAVAARLWATKQTSMRLATKNERRCRVERRAFANASPMARVAVAAAAAAAQRRACSCVIPSPRRAPTKRHLRSLVVTTLSALFVD